MLSWCSLLRLFPVVDLGSIVCYLLLHIVCIFNSFLFLQHSHDINFGSVCFSKSIWVVNDLWLRKQTFPGARSCPTILQRCVVFIQTCVLRLHFLSQTVYCCVVSYVIMLQRIPHWVYVDGLTQVPVKMSSSNATDLQAFGRVPRVRHYGSSSLPFFFAYTRSCTSLFSSLYAVYLTRTQTHQNKASSRSHVLLLVTAEQRHACRLRSRRRADFVDLAGTNESAKSEGQRLEEVNSFFRGSVFVVFFC